MKQDILWSALIGFLVALLLVIVKLSGNIEKLNTVPYVELTLVAFPILSVLGIAGALIMSKWIPVALQGAKFLLVGGLNTFLDLGVLNILIAATGISAGLGYSVFKGISFLVAVGNSYFWNKYWTFGTKTHISAGKVDSKEFFQFFIISGIGFFINVVSASFIVNILGPQFGVSKSTWPTVGALVGTLLVLSWNFLGYKFLVFKEKAVV